MSLAAIPLVFEEPTHSRPARTHLRAVENPCELVPPSVREEPTVLAPGLPPLTYKLIGKLSIFAYEVVEGTRNVGQLGSWVSSEVARQLAEHRALTVERKSLYHDTRRIVPSIRRVRVLEPMPGTAEAAVVLNTGSRTKAVALRLEGVRGRWQATSITVL